MDVREKGFQRDVALTETDVPGIQIPIFIYATTYTSKMYFTVTNMFK